MACPGESGFLPRLLGRKKILTSHFRCGAPSPCQGTPPLEPSSWKASYYYGEVGDAIHAILSGRQQDATSPESPIAKMDPYSAEGELINIHTHFYQSQYQQVVDFDTSSFSPENALPARVLQLRARLALGQVEDVLADVQGEAVPDLEAVGALAEYTLGKTDSALKTIEKLAASAADNVTVLVIGGTVLQAAGKSEEALALLSQHQGSCETCLHLAASAVN